MERKLVKSSNIKSIGYDEATKTLEIEFVKSGVYQYKAVGVEVYNGIMTADSKGKYFAANVRVNFKCEKVVNTYPKKMIQSCLVCDYKMKYEVKSKADEDIIRASCLECGHQGMFKLEDYKEEKQ